MTDDEREARIARCTELARKVWPEHELEVEPGYGEHAWQVGGDGGVSVSIDHTRALDALESALLVLSGGPTQGDLAAALDEERQAKEAALDDFKGEVRRAIESCPADRSPWYDREWVLTELRELAQRLYKMAEPTKAPE